MKDYRLRVLDERRKALSALTTALWDLCNEAEREAQPQCRNPLLLLRAAKQARTLLQNIVRQQEEHKSWYGSNTIEELLGYYLNIETVIQERDHAVIAIPALIKATYYLTKFELRVLSFSYLHYEAHIKWLEDQFGERLKKHLPVDLDQEEVITEYRETDLGGWLDVFFWGQGYPLGPGHAHFRFHLREDTPRFALIREQKTA